MIEIYLNSVTILAIDIVVVGTYEIVSVVRLVGRYEIVSVAKLVYPKVKIYFFSRLS